MEPCHTPQTMIFIAKTPQNKEFYKNVGFVEKYWFNSCNSYSDMKWVIMILLNQNFILIFFTLHGFNTAINRSYF